MVIKRGEIWWADLPEPLGSEPGYRRPVLIVQSDKFNRSKIATVIAVIITSNIRVAQAPGNVLLPESETGLLKASVANVSQTLTVDKRFLTEKVGEISTRLLNEVEDGLRLVLQL